MGWNNPRKFEGGSLMKLHEIKIDYFANIHFRYTILLSKLLAFYLI